MRLIRPNTTRQTRSATHPPARPPDSPRPPKPGAQASLRAARGPTRNHKPAASAVLARGSGPGRKAAGRPGAQRVAGAGASPRPATRRGYGLDPAAAEPCAAPWKWGAGGRLPPRGGGAPGRLGRCGRAHRSREPSVSAGPRPLPGRPTPSRAAPAGRKQRTSGLRNVPACAVQLPPRHAGSRKGAGLVLQTAGPEATFPHADAHHPGPRAIAGAWGKRAELRGRVARIRPRSLGTSSSPRGKMGGQQKTVLSAGALLSPVLVDPEGPVRARRTEAFRPLGLLSFLGGRACAPLPRSWQTPQAPAVAHLCLEVFH